MRLKHQSCPRTVPLSLVFAGLALILPGVTTPTNAQYTQPGVPQATGGIPTEETMDGNVESATWQFGILRLRPFFGIEDASLVLDTDEDGNQNEDFTATAAAGFRGYVKTGSKVVWAGHALPQYVWWQNNDEKTGFGGRYGVGFFGYFNRLTVEASHRIDQSQEFFSSEVQELTITRKDISRLAAELEIGAKFSIAVDGELASQEAQEDESVIFPALDRDEERLSVSIGYRPNSSWSFVVTTGTTARDFDQGARSLSNDETRVGVEAHYNGGRFEASLVADDRTLEPRGDSAFATTDVTTGHFDVLLAPTAHTQLLAYWRRDLLFSIQSNAQTFESERVGMRLQTVFRDSLSFGVLGEVGDDFFDFGAGNIDRSDDVTSYGVDLRFNVGKLLSATAIYLNTDYDSTLDQFDRDIAVFGLSLRLRFGGRLEKLRLGQAGSSW